MRWSLECVTTLGPDAFETGSNIRRELSRFLTLWRG